MSTTENEIWQGCASWQNEKTHDRPFLFRFCPSRLGSLFKTIFPNFSATLTVLFFVLFWVPLLGQQLSFQKTKQDFSIRWQAFLPGDVTKRPLPPQWSLEQLVNFREESSGTGRFCRLEFQRIANWPSFDQKIETGRIIRNRRPVSCNSPCFDQKIETGPVGHPLEIEACKIGQSY